MENETVKTEAEVVQPVVEQHDAEQVESSPTEQSEQVESSVNETGDSEAQEQTETKAENEGEVKPEVKTVEKKDERPSWQKDLQRQRGVIRELKAEIENLKVVKETGRQSEDDVKWIAEELGVPEDDAKKLNRILEKKLERLSRPGQDPRVAEVKKLEEGFISKVNDVKHDFEDWDEYGSEMQKAFVAEVSRLNEAGGNPLDAFRKDPDYYYYKAKSSKVTSASEAHFQGKKEMANKINQKNAASAERSNSTKPKMTQTWTRDRIEKMSVADYSKHESEINDALRRDLIK